MELYPVLSGYGRSPTNMPRCPPPGVGPIRVVALFATSSLHPAPAYSGVDAACRAPHCRAAEAFGGWRASTRRRCCRRRCVARPTGPMVCRCCGRRHAATTACQAAACALAAGDDAILARMPRLAGGERRQRRNRKKGTGRYRPFAAQAASLHTSPAAARGRAGWKEGSATGWVQLRSQRPQAALCGAICWHTCRAVDTRPAATTCRRFCK